MKLLSAKLIIEHFQKNHLASQQIRIPSLRKPFEQHVFFVTVSFQRDYKDPDGISANQLSQFRRLYFSISKYLLNNNLNRKRAQQPLTYAFVDYEGSRVRNSDALHNSMPHIHALMLLNPKHLDLFNSLLAERKLQVWMPSIRRLEVDCFDPTKGDLLTLASYCMKGYEQTPVNYSKREDLWALLPG